MRAVWGLALAVGLCVCGSAGAQTVGFGTSNSPVPNPLSDPSTTGSYGIQNMIGTPWRLSQFFQSINPFSNRNPIGYSTVPDPTAPGYLNAFGFRRVRTPY
jgi:hypothetical protein